MFNAQCLGLYDGDKIVGIIGVIPQPSTHKHLKRVTRLVILPDYQGVGLGTKLLSFTAEWYHQNGYDMSIVTTAKNFISALKRNKHWRMTRYNKPSAGKQTNMKSWIVRQVPTASFMYKP